MLNTQRIISFQGWLYVTEVYHFAQYLAKGKVRFVETLFLPDNAFVYRTPLWDSLKNTLNASILTGNICVIMICFLAKPSICAFIQCLKYDSTIFSLFIGLRGFVEQSRGQAIGSTGRKSPKTGKMVMRDTATLYEFVEGCR